MVLDHELLHHQRTVERGWNPDEHDRCPLLPWLLPAAARDACAILYSVSALTSSCKLCYNNLVYEVERVHAQHPARYRRSLLELQQNQLPLPLASVMFKVTFVMTLCSLHSSTHYNERTLWSWNSTLNSNNAVSCVRRTQRSS